MASPRTPTSTFRPIAALALLFATVSLSAAPIPNTPRDLLDRLEQQYTGVTSVHLDAHFTLTIHRDEAGQLLEQPISGMGTFEYWAEGDKYRVHFEADPRLGMLDSGDVAYDGTTHRRYQSHDDVLTLHTGDKDSVPLSLPNPFFLPVHFLTPESDACPFCRLKLSDLSEPTLWRKARSQVSATEGRPGIAVVDAVRGGPDTFELHVVPTEQGRPRLATLVREAPSGEQVRVRFSRFAVVNGSDLAAEFPMRMDVEFPSRDPWDTAGMEMRIVVDAIEINRPVADELFRLDPEPIRKVWDEDEETWIKHPSPSLMGEG